MCVKNKKAALIKESETILSSTSLWTKYPNSLLYQGYHEAM